MREADGRARHAAHAASGRPGRLRRAALAAGGAIVVGCAATALALAVPSMPRAFHIGRTAAGQSAGDRAATPAGGTRGGSGGTTESVSLRSFKPLWTPDGMEEVFRSVSSGDGELSTIRQWIQITHMTGPLGGAKTSGPMLTLRTDSKPPPDWPSHGQANINGHPAMLGGDELDCQLAWTAAPGQYVEVDDYRLIEMHGSQLVNACGVALRFARSLEPETVRFNGGFLRIPHTGGKVFTDLTRKAAGCEAFMAVPAAGAGATLGPDPLPPGGQPIRINGRPARLYAETEWEEDQGSLQPGKPAPQPTLTRVTSYSVGIDFGPGRRLSVQRTERHETASRVEQLAASIQVGAVAACGF
jgi:hypothetical protein